MRPFKISLIVFILFISALVKAQGPDLILYNGIFFTADDQHPYCEAVAIKDGKILSVGTSGELIKLKSPNTKLVNLEKKFGMPGLIEGHGHLLGLGNSMIELNLINTNRWEQILEMVREKVKEYPKDEWMEGRGWHQEKWISPPVIVYEGYPTNKELNELTPNNPLVLYHASGHALIANEYALRLAGITKSTPDPKGGRIIRDINGIPTGILEENAMDLLSAALQAYNNKQPEEKRYLKWKKVINQAQETCLKDGITTFHDAGVDVNTIRSYTRLADENAMLVRMWVMVNDNLENIKAFGNRLPIIGYGKGMLTVKAIKQYIDGALGSYGAWLLEPYTDKPEHSGQNVTSLSDLSKVANFAIDHNLQLCIHAIGDKGNREVLNIYESAEKRDTLKKDLRWRIEHAQHVSPQDFDRFKDLGVIASMQAIHCTSDAPFVEKRLGKERAQLESYAWRSLIDKGVHLANGTDTPVESVNPFECMYAAVTRKRLDTGYSFYTEQKMTRIEALKSYTIWNAYAGFEEDIKGSITPGKYADIIILDTNLLSCPDDKIPTTKVISTILNGKTVFQRLTL